MSKEISDNIKEKARDLAHACREEDVNMVLLMETNPKSEMFDRDHHRFSEMRGKPSSIIRFMNFVSDIGLIPGVIHEYLFALESDKDSPSTVQVLIRKLLDNDSK